MIKVEICKSMMLKISSIWILFAGIILIMTACDKTGNQSGESNELQVTQTDDSGLNLPEGFRATVVVDSTGPGRHLAVNTNGDIYLMLRNSKPGRSIVALRDTTGDGRADQFEYFGSHSGTGIEIHNGFLYYSSDSSVHRVKLNEDKLVPADEPETIAEGFIFRSQHEAKSFTIDDQGNLYVNVGAPSNACQEQGRTPGSPGQDPCPLLDRFAGVWRFDANQQNQHQETDGYRFVTGTRNLVALEFNPFSQHVYAVMHGRDQLNSLWPEIYSAQENADLPAEEFLLLKDGADFGWPYCYYNGLQEKNVLAPEYGGDGETIDRCEDKDKPIMAFPAHWAPNDLVFYTGNQFPEKYRQGAFIAFHGSWNRAPEEQQGYNVVFVPFNEELPSGDYEVFASGFTEQENIQNPRDAKYRPTGVAVGPDGSLYISDSRKGKIWKIIYEG
jgi:glucose/arabinose dehydrogenase